jgi:hypothetical protein
MSNIQCVSGALKNSEALFTSNYIQHVMLDLGKDLQGMPDIIMISSFMISKLVLVS